MTAIKRTNVLFLILFTIVFFISYGNSNGKDLNNPKDQEGLKSYTELLKPIEITNSSLPVIESIVIYNEDNELIAFGNEKDKCIIRLIRLSDFLIESGSTKLYRLSYQ